MREKEGYRENLERLNEAFRTGDVHKTYWAL